MHDFPKFKGFRYHLSVEGNFYMFQSASAHPCAVQGHHLHSLQCSVAVSAHSLFILYQLKGVTTSGSFFGVHSSAVAFQK
jgi:hypothetical protein